jgi:hypothetical protein
MIAPSSIQVPELNQPPRFLSTVIVTRPFSPATDFGVPVVVDDRAMLGRD